MDKMRFIILESPDDPAWAQVETLLAKMYVVMQSRGLMLPLADNGPALWSASARNTAGRFSRTVLATLDEKPVGFAHGAIKFLPDYLGGGAVGTVTHIYVESQGRRTGTGKEMARVLEDWFREKKARSVELQVISENDEGITFWENLGYVPELLQFRKLL